MERGPIAEILARQEPDGSLGDSARYGTKYAGTAWSLISLWQMGADPEDGRVSRMGECVLRNRTAPNGLFTVTGTDIAYVHCLGGNLAAALAALGFSSDGRVVAALDGIARMATGDGVAPKSSRGPGLRYSASYTSGPGFGCVINGELPCGWGAAKVLLALTTVPEARRSQAQTAAFDVAVQFLLSRDPAAADYPFAFGKAPSSSWFKFGFPVFYVTDYLQVLEGLAQAGAIRDPRCEHAIECLLARQDQAGRWKREYAPRNPIGFDAGIVGAPNKWVTLRALRVIKAWASDQGVDEW
jgi:hypothetical protein